MKKIIIFFLIITVLAAIPAVQYFTISAEATLITPSSSGLTVITSRVSSGADDAEEVVKNGIPGSVRLKSSDLELTKDNGEMQVVGMRFQNISIPRGSSIANAYIEFEVDEKDARPADLTFHGQSAGNAPKFRSVKGNVTARKKTTAFIDWKNVPAWNKISQKVQSPDLSPIIREIVNETPEWSNGNAIAILVSGTGRRVAESYNGESKNAPLLVIEYKTGDTLASKNMLENSGFEQGKTSWQNWDSEDNSGEATVSADTAFKETSSLQMSDSSKLTRQIVQDTNGIHAGKEYLFMLALKTKDLGTAQAKAHIEWLDASYKVITASPSLGQDLRATTQGYLVKKATFTAPSGASSARVKLILLPTTDGQPHNGAEVWWDEITLIEKEGDSPLPPRGKISLAFDDGAISTYSEALTIMSEYNLRGTAYIYPLAMDKAYSGYMSWDQVKNLSTDHGWEIGSHSYSHPHLTWLLEDDVHTELENASNAFSSHGINARGFASPFGDFNENVLSHAARSHIYHRTTSNNDFNIFPYNDYTLNAYDVSFDMEPARVKALIDDAIAKDAWLILYWHKLVDDNPAPYTYPIDKFREVIQYIANQQARVTTVEEQIDSWGSGTNLIQNGSFETGAGSGADGWERSDKNTVNVVNASEGNAPYPARNAQIIAGSGQYQISTLPTPVQDSAAYRIRIFSKIENMNAGSAEVWISELDQNGNYTGGQWLGGIFENFIGTKYFDYTPRPATKNIKVHLYSLAGSDFTWNIDNVEMKTK